VSFVQAEFVVFLAAVLVGYLAAGTRRAQNVWLLLASALFYGWVHPWFLGLLYLSAMVDYAAGLAMERWPEWRGRVLAAAVSVNLYVLFLFKYSDFFALNVSALLGALGWQVSMSTLGLVLPVGISFYTFQSMSYSIDVYRGQLKARRDPVDFLLYVSFFPQLVAGPIERAGHLLAQIEAPRRPTREGLTEGLTLALWGATKKLCVADSVAPYVDRVFAVPDPPLPLALAGAFAFAVQILADFSGYTDIARGVARMMGFELMENFRHPYLAASPSEFWRRWHISLSTWIRDYVYVPLGGNRAGPTRRVAATSGAMLLSGLWHGAGWNYVLWGAYHAVLLLGYRALEPRAPAALKGLPGARIAAVALMFGFTCLGWLVFRQTRVDSLVHLLAHPSLGSAEERLVAAVVTGVAVVAALPLCLALGLERWVLPRLGPGASRLQPLAWVLLLVLLFLYASDQSRAFIYFRF